MSLKHQEYADLANDSYKDYLVGVRKPGQKDDVSVNGIPYSIREHVNDVRNGYQGTIYQRVDTREIVVAHRGTEQVIRDGAVADGSMVLNRFNPQAEDAIGLTKRAMQLAELEGRRTGHAPEVTVTGHSLGGTLAQITAHRFNLRGETFNAYGATSLGLRIPEGGDKVINHVMAADTVSAGSPHYGQVRVYARQQEIDVLQQSGYDNNRSVLLDQRAPLLAVGRSLGSHSMHNFTDKDGLGHPDRSILADPNAQRLAQQFDPMIDKYRDDVRLMRAGISLSGRGPVGWVEQGVDSIRGPLAPGEPAAREAPDPRPASKPSSAPAHPFPYDSPLFGPGALPDFRDYVPKPAEGPAFPMRPQASLDGATPVDNALPQGAETRIPPQMAIDRLSPRARDNYEQALSLAQRLGLPQDKAQNFGMAMAAQISESGLMLRTDRMIAVQGRGDDGGDRVFASYHPHGDKEPIFNTSLDVNRGANTPMEDSSRRIEQTQQLVAQQQGMLNRDGQDRGPSLG